MKLKEVFLYELQYQFRSITPHVFFLVFLAMSYLIVMGNYVPDALLMEHYINSPFVIASVTIVTTMFWLLIGPATAGEAATRDIHTRMYSLVFTSPVSKTSYIGGKFLAALLMNSWILLSIPMGIIVATYTSGLEENLIGPFRMSGYLTAFLYVAFPNIFLATAVQFLFSIISKRAIASYLAGFALYIGSYVITFTAGNLAISNILDPMSYNYVISTVQRSWTPLDLSHRLISLEGVFLVNRLLWMGIGIAAVVVAYSRFKFSYAGSNNKKNSRLRMGASEKSRVLNLDLGRAITVPVGLRSFNFKTSILQVLAIASSSFWDIMKRKGGLIILSTVALFSLMVLYVNFDHQDVPMVGDTWRVLVDLVAPLGSVKIPWIFIVILIAFYAGELIWREREARLSDVYDATPTADWVLFFGKFLALAVFLITFCTFLVFVGISIQLMLGNQNIDLLLYLKILFGVQLVDYLVFALIACFIHIIVNQKYLGHFVVLLAFAFIAFGPMMGIENKLLIPGSDSGWSYTAMQGFSDMKLWALYKLYWIGWTILLAVISRLLWIRGRDYLVNKRYKLAIERISRSVLTPTLAAIILILVSGGFIFYNTRVLNTYMSSEELKAYKADYEKRFGHFRNVPQPTLLRSDLEVDFYPDQRKLNVAGTYHLANKNSVPLDTIHLYEAVEVSKVTFDRTADLMLHDQKFGHRIYKLQSPLQPGDSLSIKFQLSYRNDDLSGKNASKYVVDNGSFFRNYQVLPAIGYQFLMELKEKSDREAYNLKPKPELAPLSDKQVPYELLMWDHRSMVQAVVSTNGDQIAVGPGKLLDSWSKDDRQYFRYATDAPIRGEFSFFSADYKVYEDRWKNVNIQIYHHPEHTQNLDRMVAGMKRSLEYYSEQFGPYPYDQLRLVEHPGKESGLHAAPINIDFYEGFSYMNPEEDERELDFVFAVVGHDVAHQWWGNLLRYARVEGGGILSESLAWYSALKMVENEQGKLTAIELLKQLKKEYDVPKSRADVPLIKGNGFFQLYRQGPLALYTISEYIGEDHMNKGLQNLFSKHGNGQPPLATSMDLFNEIVAVTPDSLQYLVHDLFMENTFWDLEMEEAVAEKTETGDWKVTLKIKTNKEVVDDIGRIKEKQMDDWIEIGIYGMPQAAESTGELLYLNKHKLKSGEQTIVINVPKEPGNAGVDPHQLLDRNSYDNFERLRTNEFSDAGVGFN
ncbi:MAG: M1 family aminopeptidase [Salinimicrobium sediminis]|nr:M1 family aminopeptidase [Salinimicrobium sediminis]